MIRSERNVRLDSNKVSNLFSYIRHKYGEDCVRLLRDGKLTLRKWQIIEIIEGSL